MFKTQCVKRWWEFFCFWLKYINLFNQDAQIQVWTWKLAWYDLFQYKWLKLIQSAFNIHWIHPLPFLHLCENVTCFMLWKAVCGLLDRLLLLFFSWQHTQFSWCYQFATKFSITFISFFIWICTFAKSQEKGSKETEIEHASEVMSRLLSQSGIRSTWSSPNPTEPPGWPCSSCFFLPYQNTYMHFSHSNRTTGGLALNSNQPGSQIGLPMHVWFVVSSGLASSDNHNHTAIAKALVSAAIID